MDSKKSTSKRSGPACRSCGKELVLKEVTRFAGDLGGGGFSVYSCVNAECELVKKAAAEAAAKVSK